MDRKDIQTQASVLVNDAEEAWKLYNPPRPGRRTDLEPSTSDVPSLSVREQKGPEPI